MRHVYVDGVVAIDVTFAALCDEVDKLINHAT